MAIHPREVAPLALGGNVFGWTADAATSFRLMDAFVAAGGQMIDTADSYSAWVPGHAGGESERVIGDWLKRSGKRDEVVIASKVGFLEGLAPAAIRKACAGSLDRLGTEIDLYYLHTDDQQVPLADTLGAVDALVKEGKVRSIGLSNFTPERIDAVMATCAAEGLTRPVALQPWYNLVERERYEAGLRAAAQRHDLAVFPYYAIANGFLAGKYRSKDDLSKSPRGLRNIAYLEGRGPRVLEAMDEVSAETGAPLASIALAWLAAQPTITAPIAKATSLAQLSELTASLTLRLSAAQLDRLAAASA
ncbi:aldo/keto reductase [Sphingomicrobium astaxanthinifaciens]|uniref:aldo/keto reductase n=1 Tax=Sphingomicrobium astaxanthinifaciens TaxID=1227949 RepID=UPI001FCB7165|nr:aldo/keto reductase [Sphingomicrobium astaxanthinifaciens]MCJ7420728.1 aldo/keto reductase [Sphingomicrobium astaxanthinifaciens]